MYSGGAAHWEVSLPWGCSSWCVQRKAQGIQKLGGPRPSCSFSWCVCVPQDLREALPGGRQQKPFQMSWGPVGCGHSRDHLVQDSFFHIFKHGKLFFKQIKCVNSSKFLKKGKTEKYIYMCVFLEKTPYSYNFRESLNIKQGPSLAK